MYLHFKCYLLSWFPLHIAPFPFPLPLLLWRCSPSHPPTPNSPHWHSPTLGHPAFTGPRAFLLIDVRKCHILLHMRLEPWVPPRILFGWWFSPWELWVVQLVDIVLPIGLQFPSAPSVLPLALPLVSPGSVQWLAVSASVLVRCWQGPSGNSYIRFLSASTSWHQQ